MFLFLVIPHNSPLFKYVHRTSFSYCGVSPILRSANRSSNKGGLLCVRQPSHILINWARCLKQSFACTAMEIPLPKCTLECRTMSTFSMSSFGPSLIWHQTFLYCLVLSSSGNVKSMALCTVLSSRTQSSSVPAPGVTSPMNSEFTKGIRHAQP